jgi:hypothetical protein
MASPLPTVSGIQLLCLLEKDGWINVGNSTHGITLKKKFNDKYMFTTIPLKHKEMPEWLLGQIFSVKQTGLKKAGLRRLINTYRKECL